MCGPDTSPLIETRLRVYPREEPPWEVVLAGADPRTNALLEAKPAECRASREWGAACAGGSRMPIPRQLFTPSTHCFRPKDPNWLRDAFRCTPGRRFGRAALVQNDGRDWRLPIRCNRPVLRPRSRRIIYRSLYTSYACRPHAIVPGSRTPTEQVDAMANAGRNCWDACGGQAGPCPLFCGARGLCCRAGQNLGEGEGCGPDSLAEGLAGCPFSHCCTDPTPGLPTRPVAPDYTLDWPLVLRSNGDPAYRHSGSVDEFMVPSQAGPSIASCMWLRVREYSQALPTC